MFYKIQNDDVFKILPIIDSNDKILPLIESRCLWLPKANIMVYDIENKILPRLCKVAPKSERMSPHSMSKKYFISVLINGEMKAIAVGKRIFDKVIENPNATNLKDNTQLLVKIEMVQSSIGLLPSYDHSTFIESDWKRPFDHLEQNIWIEWLKSGQSDMWRHLRKFDVKNHISEVEDEIGKSGIIGEILAEFRNQKLDIILE